LEFDIFLIIEYSCTWIFICSLRRVEEISYERNQIQCDSD
jgi:hypothetical protein